MTPLDCIREGEYDFTPKGKQAWRELFKAGGLSTAVATVKVGYCRVTRAVRHEP